MCSTLKCKWKNCVILINLHKSPQKKRPLNRTIRLTIRFRLLNDWPPVQRNFFALRAIARIEQVVLTAMPLFLSWKLSQALVWSRIRWICTIAFKLHIKLNNINCLPKAIAKKHRKNAWCECRCHRNHSKATISGVPSRRPKCCFTLPGGLEYFWSRMPPLF